MGGPTGTGTAERTARPGRRRRTVWLLLALTATSLPAAALVGDAGAGAVPVPPTGVLWEQVQEIPDGTGGLASALIDLACPTATECVAVGSVEDQSAGEPVVATSTNGVWSPMQALSLTGLPTASPVEARAAALDCTGAGACTLVGDFRATDASVRPFAATSSGGTWGAAVPIDVSTLSTEWASLADVSCSSAGACTAVGRYRVGGEDRAWTITSTGGVWGSPHPVVFSGAAGATGWSRATDVACWTGGDCTVAGQFRTAGDVMQVFTTSSTTGTWSDAVRLALPADVATNGDAFVDFEFVGDALACTGVQVCALVGIYESSTPGFTQRPFVANSAGGGFGAAQGISFPSGYHTEAAISSSIMCPAGGNCMAAGWVTRYGCSSGPNCIISPWTATSSGGTWSTATPLATTDEINARSLSGAFDVSCVGNTDNCAVVGQFLNASDGWESLAATRVGGEWSLARRVAGPDAPGSPDDYTMLIDVECTGSSRCSAIGINETGNDPPRAVAVEAWPMPSAPRNLSLTTTPNSRTVTVSWTPPGPVLFAPSARPPAPVGPQPESYQIRCETNSGDPVFVGATTSPTRINLPAGATARCGVRARYGTAVPDNSFLGDWFEGPLGWTNTVTVPTSPPDAPTGVTATNPTQPAGRSSAIAFTLPPNVSGAPVTSVETRCTSTDGGTTRTTTGLASPLVVNDLTIGRTYRCTVRATNRIGSSGWVTTNPITVPTGPPTNVRVTSANKYGAVTVTFTKPSGGPIPTGYRTQCTSTNGGTTRTLVKNAAPFIVEGLTKGRTYRCTTNAMFATTPGPTSDPSPTLVIP